MPSILDQQERSRCVSVHVRRYTLDLLAVYYAYGLRLLRAFLLGYVFFSFTRIARCRGCGSLF
jgi:hypothetical protein